MKKMSVAGLLLSIGLFIGLNASAEKSPQDTLILGAPVSTMESMDHGSYYNWGKAQNGWGYCYEWTSNGAVLNGGQPVANSNCEWSNPSRFEWGAAQNGWGYCYQRTPTGLAMNEGQPVGNYSCERTSHSHYSWGNAQNGNTYCYQYTSNNICMNAGQPVDNFYCR